MDTYCSACEKKFKNPGSLGRHRFRFHRANDLSPYLKPFGKGASATTDSLPVCLILTMESYCFYCRKYFKNPGSLATHWYISHRNTTNHEDHCLKKRNNMESGFNKIN